MRGCPVPIRARQGVWAQQDVRAETESTPAGGPTRLVLGDHERLALRFADGRGALGVAVDSELQLGGERGGSLGLLGALPLLLARRHLLPVLAREERGLGALAGAELRGQGARGSRGSV